MTEAPVVTLSKPIRLLIKPVETEIWASIVEGARKLIGTAPSRFVVQVEERIQAEENGLLGFLGKTNLTFNKVSYRFVFLERTDKSPIVENKLMRLHVALFPFRPALCIQTICPGSELLTLDDFKTPSLRGIAFGLTF
jgi:hypothetical protein